MKRKRKIYLDSSYLVTGGIPQTREERGEFAGERSRRIFLKDNLVESACGRDLVRETELIQCPHNNICRWGRLQATGTHLALVAHQSLRSGIDLVMALESKSKITKKNILFCSLGGEWFVQDGKPSARQYQQYLSGFPSKYNRTLHNRIQQT